MQMGVTNEKWGTHQCRAAQCSTDTHSAGGRETTRRSLWTGQYQPAQRKKKCHWLRVRAEEEGLEISRNRNMNESVSSGREEVERDCPAASRAPWRGLKNLKPGPAATCLLQPSSAQGQLGCCQPSELEEARTGSKHEDGKRLTPLSNRDKIRSTKDNGN